MLQAFEIETYDASTGYFRTPGKCPDFRIHVYQMCRVGKLSYVAGAELPTRDLA